MTGGILVGVKEEKVGEKTNMTISNRSKVSMRIHVFLVMVSTNI
jgi:hypothetical protein